MTMTISKLGVLARALALIVLLLLGWVLPAGPALAGDTGVVVVIGHPGLPKLDGPTLARLYTGRSVEVAGNPVTVVNLPAGSPQRQRFLQQFVQQTEEQYLAYWTVRRHVGKGTPPRELSGAGEVIGFVQATPGAIGYIDASDLRPGLNLLAR